MDLNKVAIHLAALEAKGWKIGTRKQWGEFLRDNLEHIDEIGSLLYGPALVKPNHVMSGLRRSFGLFPEEGLRLTADEDIIDILASESPESMERHMTIPEALSLMKEIGSAQSKVDLRDVFMRMNNTSATTFWKRALGEPHLLTRRRLMRAVGHTTEYAPERLTKHMMIQDLGIVVRRAYEGTLPHNHLFEPTIPFRAPSYGLWRYWTLPFDTCCYEILRAPIRYQHIKDGRAVIFDSLGRVVNDSDSATFRDAPDSISEIDADGNVIAWIVREGEPDLWKRPYAERAERVNYLSEGPQMRTLLSDLREGEVMRLIAADRGFVFGLAKGGFIAHRRMGDIPLIIERGRKNDEEYAILSIAALDGFDPIRVGAAKVRLGALQHPILQPIASSTAWYEIGTTILGIFHTVDVEENGKLRAPHFVEVASNLGHSDAIQIGDLMMLARGIDENE